MRERFNEALKQAMKAQDKRQVATLRLIIAAIKDRDIAARGAGSGAASDEELLQLLAKMIRQREESADIYDKAGRPELAAQEREEADIIRAFLPRQMDEDETREACRQVVAELGATGMKDMGRSMALLKERHAGSMDFSLASRLVKELLGG